MDLFLTQQDHHPSHQLQSNPPLLQLLVPIMIKRSLKIRKILKDMVPLQPTSLKNMILKNPLNSCNLLMTGHQSWLMKMITKHWKKSKLKFTHLIVATFLLTIGKNLKYSVVFEAYFYYMIFKTENA